MHSDFCILVHVQREATSLIEMAFQNQASSCSGNRQTQHPYPSTRRRRYQSHSSLHRAVADGLQANEKHCVAVFQLDRFDDEGVLLAATLLVQCGLVKCDVVLAIPSRQPHVLFAPVLCVLTLPCSLLVETIRSTVRELARSCLFAHGQLRV
jgi:hypothetical protein